MLREKNIDAGVEKKDEKKKSEKNGGRRERTEKIVTEVDRRSLAGLSVRTKKGEFNNDISLLLGFPLCRNKLIKM